MAEISIVIPAHERTRELERCLNSIRESRLRDCEIVLVCDTKNRAISNLAHQYLLDRDHYIMRGGKPGAAESRNVGLQAASGQRIVIFDDDDAFPGVGYQDYVDEALATPGHVLYADVLTIEEDRKRQIVLDKEPVRVPSSGMEFSQIYVKNFIYTQACIFPAEAVRGFWMDTHMRTFVDWEFLLAVASRTPFKASRRIGAHIYKDYVNEGMRHSTSDCMKNYELVLDYLYVYRRWAAPNEALTKLRSALMSSAGLGINQAYL